MSKSVNLSNQAITLPSNGGICDMVRDATVGAILAPLVRVAEPVVISVLQKIKHGFLKVCTRDQTYTFPSLGDAQSNYTDDAQDYIELRVVNPTFWIRLLTMGDLGFGEAYMYGEVECDNLTGLFEIFLANRQNMSDMSTMISPLFSLLSRVMQFRFINTISNSRYNISAHYDISNSMFEAFLSEDMTYSCGIFAVLDGDQEESSSDSSQRQTSLDSAKPAKTSTSPPPPYCSIPPLSRDDLHNSQIRKLRHIIRKADVHAHHNLLEIGSGWGSFAILVAQEIGCTVDTITLSRQQQEFAQCQVSQLGLEGKIRVHLMDYRKLPPEWENKFDRIVSIEMIEAVGKEYLEIYFKVIDWALKPVDGIAVIQSITIPEARYERYVKEVDFIRKWVIFPGGILPTVSTIIDATRRGSNGRLICESLDNIGPHYARTLREWRSRFNSAFYATIAPSLLAEHPHLMAGTNIDYELEVFKRKWIYYFCYCEIGFTKRILGDHIIVFLREGCEGYPLVPCY